jgi:hypothetical protein
MAMAQVPTPTDGAVDDLLREPFVTNFRCTGLINQGSGTAEDAMSERDNSGGN